MLTWEWAIKNQMHKNQSELSTLCMPWGDTFVVVCCHLFIFLLQGLGDFCSSTNKMSSNNWAWHMPTIDHLSRILCTRRSSWNRFNYTVQNGSHVVHHINGALIGLVCSKCCVQMMCWADLCVNYRNLSTSRSQMKWSVW